MRCGNGVLGRSGAALLRERRRETLVVGLDGDLEPVAERLDEHLGRPGLLAALASQRQRQTDDDQLRLVLGDERREAIEARLGLGPLDDADRPSQRSRRIGDGHPGPRRAEVEGHDLHRSIEA